MVSLTSSSVHVICIGSFVPVNTCEMFARLSITRYGTSSFEKS